MGELRRNKGDGGKPLWIASLRRWRAQYTDANGRRRQVSSAIPGRKGERACAKARDAKLALVRQGLEVGEASEKRPPITARTINGGVGESVWPEGIHRLAPIYQWRTDEEAIRRAISYLLERGTIPCGIYGRAMRSSLEIHVDHDHATRVVRGYLCRDCNLGLGHFKDQVDLLRRAQHYLELTDDDLLRKAQTAMEAGE